MIISPITPEYRDEVNAILKREWDCPPIISRGIAIDTTRLPGFVALDEGTIVGVVTNNVTDNQCEIVTLNSFAENMGIGTPLINSVRNAARAADCRRVWLITTNDDIPAILFYQRKGFNLVAAHIDAIEVSRQLKPSILHVGMYGIPIRHELEFEIEL